MEELEIILEKEGNKELELIGLEEENNELDLIVLEEEIKEITQSLENLEITPSGVEQYFKSENYYGYDEVKVKAVASYTLNAVPTEKNQTITGLYGIVNIEKIPEEYVVPKVENEILILSRGKVEGGVLSL